MATPETFRGSLDLSTLERPAIDLSLARRGELRLELLRDVDDPEEVPASQPSLSHDGLAWIAGRSLAAAVAGASRAAVIQDARAQAIATESTVRRLVQTPLSQRQLDAIVAHAQRIGIDAFRHSPLLVDLDAGVLDRVAAYLAADELAIFEGGDYGDVPDDPEIDFDREIPLARVGDVETVLDPDAVVRGGPPAFASQGRRIPRWDRVRIDERSADDAHVRVSTPAGATIGWTLRTNLGGYFKDDPKLAAVALAPPQPLAIDDAWPSGKAAIARAFNRLGGLMYAIHEQTGIPIPAVLAVWKVESGGAAHTSGKAIIRFENHLLYNRWGREHVAAYDASFQHGGHAGVGGSSWKNHRFRADPSAAWQTFHGEQSREYEVLAFARQLVGDADALSCISIGGPQILISNRRLIGYESERAMYDAFQADERAHVLGFFDYCQYATGYIHRRRELLRDLRALRWVEFARGYNGGGQAEAYGDALASAYATAASLPLPPPSAHAAPAESPPPTPLSPLLLSARVRAVRLGATRP